MIKIKIGADNKELQNDYDEKGRPIASVDLQIRRDMAGNYMITDHSDMDITIIVKKGRIVTIPKVENESDDTAYETQNRFYKFLSQQGIVDPTTIQGGNVIGTLEAKMLKPKKETINPIQVAIFTIGKFMENERPHYMFKQAFKEKEQERLTDPSDEFSTEFGEVPHQDQQGSIDPNYWANGANFRIYENKINESRDYYIGNFYEGKLDGDYYITFVPSDQTAIIRNKNNAGGKSWTLRIDNEADIKYLKKVFSGSDQQIKLATLSEIFKGLYGKFKLGRYDLGRGNTGDIKDGDDDGLLDFASFTEIPKRKNK